MSDEATADDDKPASDAAGPLAGERLAAARREKQISVAEIAKELHIDEHKVRSLERNEFEVLGAPVFAKGHLRKYSQLVGVPVEDVLADYYALNRSVGMPPLVGRSRPSSREINLGRWLAVLLLVGIAGVAWWWLVEREAAPPGAPGAASGRVSLPAQADDDVPASDATESQAAFPDASRSAAADASGGTVLEEPVVEQAAPAMSSSQSPETAPAAPGDVQLALAFSGDCWTEITDASGERLFFGLGSDGRRVTVSGPPPLSVMFGNAENVSVEVNGSSYAFPPGSRRGRIARFSIQAP